MWKAFKRTLKEKVHTIITYDINEKNISENPLENAERYLSESIRYLRSHENGLTVKNGPIDPIRA